MWLRNDTVGQNFQLPVGLLTYTPPKLDVSLLMGTTKPVTLTLTNSGGSPATWELKELDKGMVPFGPFQEPTYGMKPFKQGFPNTAELNPPTPPEAAPFAAGDVIQSWPISIYGWGITDDPSDGTLSAIQPVCGFGRQ